MSDDREIQELCAEFERLQAALDWARAAFGGGGSAPTADSLQMIGLLCAWEDLMPAAEAFAKDVKATLGAA